jgi:ribonuclease HI
MYDLGFPADAIHIVKDLYTNATTRVRLPLGRSAAIKVDRGTIQGDTLSPFLFLVFIEPLLRWLHSGGRGYRYGCLNGENNEQHNCSSLAYADDLAILTNSISDLRVQCEKLEQYCKWSGLSVNVDKCAATGVLYRDIKSGLINSSEQEKELKRRLDGIKINQKTIPYLPPTQPYKYLGIQFTMTMDWSHQLNYTIEKISKKCERLTTSFASPKQRLRIIDTVIKPAVTYAMPLCPYSAIDIATLDARICKYVKDCMRLPRYMPNQAIHLDRGQGGLGITSLMVDYTQLSASYLIQALNDTDRLGTVCTALTRQQLQAMPRLAPTHIIALPRCFSIVRRIALAKRAGISIQDHGTQLLGTEIDPAWEQIIGKETESDIRITAIIRQLRPLWEIGITTVNQLITTNRQGTYTVKSAEDLKKASKMVKPRHMIALNKLTLLLTKPENMTMQQIHKYKSIGSLRPAERTIPEKVCTAAGLDTQPPQPILDPKQTTLPLSQVSSTRSQPRPKRKPAELPVGVDLHRTEDHTNRKLTRHQRISAERAAEERYADECTEVHLDGAPELEWEDLLKQNFKGLNTHEKTQLRTITPRQFMLEVSKGNLLTPGLIFSLYFEQDTLKQINHGPIKKRCSSTSNAVQKVQKEYYQVQWEDSIILKTHLEKYAQMGYMPKHTEPVEDPTTCHTALKLHRLFDGCQIELVKVTWTPRDELTDTLEGQPDWETHKQKYKARLDANYDSQKSQRRRDKDLTNLQQQGIWKAAPLHGNFTHIYRHVTFNPNAVNPDTDIRPPGQYHIQLGLSAPWIQQFHILNPNTAYIFNPDGHCIGTLSRERLTYLYRQYSHTTNTTLHTLPAASFAEEVAKLMMRYKHTTLDLACKTSCTQSTWSVCNTFMKALQTSLHIQHERFASPLDVNINTRTYWSAFPEDSVFGSSGSAFDAPWHGISVVHPAADPAMMEKAVRWSIGSAATCDPDTPTLNIILLPDLESSPYKNYTCSPSVHLIDTIPAKHAIFNNPRHCTGMMGDAFSKGKHNINVYAVGNQAGLRHLQQQWGEFTTQYKAATSHTPHPNPYTPGQTMQYNTPSAGFVAFKVPKRLALMNPTAVSTTESLTPQQPIVLPPPCEHITNEVINTFSPIHPPAHNWQQAIYTDGSCKQTETGGRLLGAAFYDPESDAVRLINPNGITTTNTILRAELSALVYALETYHARPTLTIFTDSLCSIYLIKKILHRPHLLRHSKYRPQLERMAAVLRNRCLNNCPTHIGKVKSHIGIRGNEAADKAAGQAAITPSHDFTDTSENQIYKTMYWPSITKTTDGDTTHYMVSNLNKALKTHIHPTCNTGFSRETEYAKLWAQTRTDLDGSCSNHMWKACSDTEVRTALMFRWGAVLTMKKLAMFNKDSNPHAAQCPLCKCPDSGTHMLMECHHTNMKSMQISRHNEAVKTILKCIRKGNMGASYCLMDAGILNHSETEELDAEESRIPAWMLPNIPWEIRTKMRPDILVAENVTQNDFQNGQPSDVQALKARAIIRIVEVGYCMDLSSRAKFEAKAEQHKLLCQYLKNEGWNVVTPEILIFGATGSVFNTAESSLMRLGADRSSAQNTLKTIHVASVTWAHKILIARRQLEAKCNHKYHKKPPPG